MNPSTFTAALRSFAPTLANHLWQSTAFAAAVWVLTLLLRNNAARLRYSLWLAASLKFLVPFSLLISLGAMLPRPQHAAAPAVVYAIDLAGQPFTQPEPILFAPAAAPHIPTLRERLTTAAPLAVFTLWLTGAAIVLLLWYLRWRQLARTLRAATPAHSGRELAILRRLEAAIEPQNPAYNPQPAAENTGAVIPAQPQSPYLPVQTPQSRVPHSLRSFIANRVGYRLRQQTTAFCRLATPPAIPILLSTESLEPGIFGILRPKLLWPQRLSDRLQDQHIAAILAHELMHVRRRDNLAAALHMLVEVLFWFHPVVWLIERRLIEERERACDEAVLHLGAAPNTYAEGLLKAVRFCIESPLPCVSGISGANLKHRITQIMAARAYLKLSLAKKLLLTATALIAITAPILSGQAKAMQRLTELTEELAPHSSSLTFANKKAENPASEPPSTTESTTPVSGPDSSTAKQYQFDVASVRPTNPNSNNACGMQFAADGLHICAFPLGVLIQIAYQLEFVDSRIVGGPEWLRTSQFDIQAKVAESDAADWAKLSSDTSRAGNERRLRMLQVLLADQFKLKVHRETRDGQIYTIVVAKGGPKLQPAKPDELPGIISRKRGHLTVSAATISSMAPYFAQELGHVVLDRTGLTGKYDFTLNWSPQTGTTSTTDPLPSLFTAVQEQLGLKLEPQRGPVEYLVIDHVEKPSLDGAESNAARFEPVAQVQQDAASTPTPAPFVFEVSTVKLNNSGSDSGSHTGMNHDRFTATNVLLKTLIQYQAYGIPEPRILGGPKWLDSQRFDIEAKLDPATLDRLKALPRDQGRPAMQAMFQQLLADRFHLIVHWETRDLPVYNLVAANKNGPTLPAAKDPDHSGTSAGTGQLQCVGCTLPEIAQVLTQEAQGELGRVVLDKTGLAGRYDIRLKWTPDTDSPASAPPSSQPSFFTAIQEQLGLKLEPARGPVQVLVIDRADLPTEN